MIKIIQGKIIKLCHNGDPWIRVDKKTQKKKGISRQNATTRQQSMNTKEKLWANTKLGLSTLAHMVKPKLVVKVIQVQSTK